MPSFNYLQARLFLTRCIALSLVGHVAPDNIEPSRGSNLHFVFVVCRNLPTEGFLDKRLHAASVIILAVQI